MESALSWPSINANHLSNNILFCTDSKSLCEALISSNHRISSISSSIFIQWILGHPVISGNELADNAAKEVNTIATNTSLPFPALYSLEMKQFTMIHQHTKAPHTNLPTSKAFSCL